MYGRQMESKAKAFLKDFLDSDIHDVGLVTKKNQPWLCSSPDGILLHKTGEIVALEIKCPSSCAGKNITVPYIENDKLKENHPYYTQIQIQLYCCDLNMCLLLIYSSRDFKLIEVPQNKDFL